MAWPSSRQKMNYANARQQPLLIFENSISRNQEQADSAFSELTGKSSDDHRRSIVPLFTVTPPSRKSVLSPPNAPLKSRKTFAKTGLMPRRLSYTENRWDAANEVTSTSYESKDPISTSVIKNEIYFGLRGRRDGSVIKDLSLATSDKENKGHVRRGPPRRAKEETKKHERGALSKRGKNDSSAKDLLLYKKLLNLYSFRDVGMKIQCCRKSCRKWRYCDDYHDPVDVPKIWYCEMNSDKTIASCLVPEIPNSQEEEEDLIENKYNGGSIVWARLIGYPWWPAMVEDCPETLRYYELQEPSIIPVRYHVTFFGDRSRHSWLARDSIKPFVKHAKSEMMKKTTYYGRNYKKQLEEAYTLARSALPLTILQRLCKFGYIAFLKNKSESPEIYDDNSAMDHDKSSSSSDEVIPCTPQNKVKYLVNLYENL